MASTMLRRGAWCLIPHRQPSSPLRSIVSQPKRFQTDLSTATITTMGLGARVLSKPVWTQSKATTATPLLMSRTRNTRSTFARSPVGHQQPACHPARSAFDQARRAGTFAKLKALFTPAATTPTRSIGVFIDPQCQRDDEKVSWLIGLSDGLSDEEYQSLREAVGYELYRHRRESEPGIRERTGCEAVEDAIVQDDVGIPRDEKYPEVKLQISRSAFQPHRIDRAYLGVSTLCAERIVLELAAGLPGVLNVEKEPIVVDCAAIDR